LVIVGTAALAWASTQVSAPTAFAQAASEAAADKAGKSDAGGAAAIPAPEKKSPGKKAKEKAKGEKAKPRGRLPNYFSGVVNEEQREKIYAIQKEYEPKISQLRQELDSLTKARDEKINAVLTAEQKKKIDDLKAAAKQPREKKETAEPKRETRKEKKAKTEAKPAEPPK